MTSEKGPLVYITMGSNSDWPVMGEAAKILTELEIPHEAFVTSAHRTPDRIPLLVEKARQGGVKVIIAGAGGAAHLPGMLAAHANTIPVLGVPVGSSSTNVNDLAALLSIVQMPGGVPVATFAVGQAGAKNAALFAAAIIGFEDEEVRLALSNWRWSQSKNVPDRPIGT